MGSGRYRRAVVLASMMGSGKTSVGRVRAQRLGRELIERDDRVAATRGRPPVEPPGDPPLRMLTRAAREALPVCYARGARGWEHAA